MAWNGGVSLAVWMGGVAVEIDSARRSAAAVQPATDDEQTRKVYAAISKALNRQLVVDILCGASAGGLNGALLAAAMVNGRRLPTDLMRAKWIGIGDFSSLLQPIENSEPKSIMQGGSSPSDPGIFYREVRRFFAAILDSDGADPDEEKETRTTPPIARTDVHLDVMMTNVAGEPVSFRDVWGFELAAREYRAPFRFRYPEDYTLEALATAARASASFPFAFEPFKIVGDAAVRAGLAGDRYAVDGGLLENAPIKPAIEAIPDRPASTPVKRFVCYVNAAPPTAAPAEEDPVEPTLRDVAGYIINIPRDGRFVDQLYAIRDEARRGLLASKLQPDLLRMPMGSLEATATALLRTYRLRRLATALEEIVEDPAQVADLLDEALDGDTDAENIPWLPDTVNPPAIAVDWRWGIAPAERILHLEIDILRGLIPEGDPRSRERVLQARGLVQAQLARLIDLRNIFIAEMGRLVGAPGDIDLLGAMAGLDVANREQVTGALDAAWAAFSEVLLDERLYGINNFGAFVNDLLDGSALQAGEARQRFDRRALSIEVIRRAFNDDAAADTAQQLLFAQLTPVTPTEIFRHREGDGGAPDSGEDKLTGIRLGHFAAFYRSSWRANDFMWGRLDGATRVVDLLLEDAPARAEELRGLGAKVNISAFVADLLAVGESHASVRDWLVDELLTEGDGDLTARLTEAIGDDLNGGDGSLTRRVCATLAQLEVVAEELPVLVSATANDMKLGCFTTPLKFDPENDLRGTIEQLRSGFAADQKEQLRLPDLLGRDSGDEATSDLALHTIAQALIITLATVRNINVVLGKVVAAFRVPFVSIVGLTARPQPTPKKGWLQKVVSRVPSERIGTVGSFFGASSYIALRLTTTHERHAGLGSLWSVPTLLYWVSALALFGVILVPLVRIAKTHSDWRRFRQIAWLIGLVGTALALPIFFASWKGKLPFAEIIATAGSRALPAALTGLALAVAIAGVPTLKFLPGFVSDKVAGLLKRLPLTALLGAIGFVLGGYSSRYLGAASAWWQWAAAASAWASVLVFAGYSALGSKT